MGLLLALLIAIGLMNAQTPAAVSVKEDGTALRSGCADDAPVMQQLAAGSPIELRFALSGETVPCYKVAVEVGGRQIEGYLPATAIAGLDSFDKGRKEAAWVTVNEALNAARNAASIEALKAPEGTRSSLPASAKVILAQADQLIEANQPGKALAMLEPEIQKRRDPAFLSMAGVAAWRADEAKRALEYWRESLDLAPNPDIEKLYRRVEKEQIHDQSGEKLYGVRVVLRYDADTVPVETARGMVKAVDSTFARVSEQLGCYAEEKIVTIIQSRNAYKKATDAAEWSGGQYDGRIRVPVMSGQQMDARQEQVLAHETTHACLAMLGEWPSWLQEGMAQKLSGETLPPQARAQLAELAKAGQLPKLEALRRGWSGLDTQSARLAYSLALEAVDALYDNFGTDGIRNLMRNPERLPAVSAELDKRLGL
jgi:tetratricopeptide (TPR) repeat protein